ncbi:UDP-glucose iridoid glucosyltransferase-like [Quercus robur]|uniref:UDP-glucose iridoid glucosyltransferase-like n=1 Tax=Quercus robur TaxID=38942 RepID=UPI00216286BC|nr:UDP-glucose iridoid glucosyltransferase-like [Quercus robur]
MEKQEAKRLGHRLVLVVYPFQSHINPMLQLATILYSKGFSITIAHPQFNSPNHENHLECHFVSIPDGLSKTNFSPSNFMAAISALNSNCEAPFQQYMEEMMKVEDPHDQVAGVVYEGFMHFAQAVANNLKLPGINVRTSAAATLLLFAVFPDAHHEKGYISFPESLSQAPVPELQSLDLKGILGSTEIPTPILELRATVTDATKKASAMIVNTVHFLEQQTLTKVQEHFPSPVFSLGPFHKLAPSASSSLLKEDTTCISWLDKQAPKSVIYISFGSMVSMDEKELVEIAWGLANSEQPFLWVVRPGSVRGLEWIELLPESFKERVEGRGCIVKWTPQKEVLAHGAVGGFWSHCGWNSTLESVCEGVPMLCRPYFGDQGLSAKYVCSVWKVVLELEGVLERGKIERAIRRLMVETEGVEIRQRAKDLKHKAELCLSEDGSTYNALNELAQHILPFG